MFALRGAISVEHNDADEILDAGEKLVRTLLLKNNLEPLSILSAYFTSTPDLTAAFPATGARRAGFEIVPMMCAQEIPVPSAPQRIIRVMLHVDGSPRVPAHHVYLGEATKLRPDLVREVQE
jgi:chorismate mutase